MHLKWRCTIDTPLPTRPLLHHLSSPHLYLHVTQNDLRDVIRQVEVGILHPRDQIEDIICVAGHNSAVHYLTYELNDTQHIKIQEKITVITENQISLEHQLKQQGL